MRKHQEAVIGHVLNSDPPISYTRICQVDDVEAPFANAKTQAMIDHCRTMYELKARKEADTVVKVSRKKFPYKFIVIDRESIVLQLENVEENNDDMLIWGELLITDPRKELIDVFLQLWKDIDNDPSTKSVSATHLGLEPAEFSRRRRPTAPAAARRDE
jgi:hypothetical protein